MVSKLGMHSLFEQDVNKYFQYHESFPNTVILLVSVNIIL